MSEVKSSYISKVHKRWRMKVISKTWRLTFLIIDQVTKLINTLMLLTFYRKVGRIFYAILMPYTHIYPSTYNRLAYLTVSTLIRLKSYLNFFLQQELLQCSPVCIQTAFTCCTVINVYHRPQFSWFANCWKCLQIINVQDFDISSKKLKHIEQSCSVTPTHWQRTYAFLARNSTINKHTVM